jgi:hypothetical protein
MAEDPPILEYRIKDKPAIKPTSTDLYIGAFTVLGVLAGLVCLLCCFGYAMVLVSPSAMGEGHAPSLGDHVFCVGYIAASFALTFVAKRFVQRRSRTARLTA